MRPTYACDVTNCFRSDLPRETLDQDNPGRGERDCSLKIGPWLCTRRGAALTGKDIDALGMRLGLNTRLNRAAQKRCRRAGACASRRSDWSMSSEMWCIDIQSCPFLLLRAKRMSTILIPPKKSVVKGLAFLIKAIFFGAEGLE